MDEGRTEKSVISVDVPVITGPRTYEEFRAQFCAATPIATAVAYVEGAPVRHRWWPDHEIVPGRRTGAELCTWLENRCDVERLPESRLGQTRRWSVRWNIEHCDLLAECPDADLEHLEVVAYRLLPTERNHAYFTDGYGDPEELTPRMWDYLECLHRLEDPTYRP